MSNELQKGLPERIKDFLQLEGEHSLLELAGHLREFRNGTHPDRFQDEDLKRKAEARVKDAHALLDEIEKHLEVEQFNRKPTEMTLYKSLYDAVQLQSKLDKADKELEDTKRELTSEREQSEKLTMELAIKKDDSLNADIKHLQSIYRPSTRKYASIGLAILLTGALGVMWQMERVSSILEAHSPFGKKFIGTGLFICLVLFLAEMLRKMWESGYIKRKSEEMCSPKCAQDFMQYLEKRTSSLSSDATFSEVDAFDFITGNNQHLKSLISYLGFHIFRRDTTNRLKDIFIHSLLNKKLIEFSNAEKLQRHFKITNAKDESEYWRDKWWEERTKNESLSKS